MGPPPHGRKRERERTHHLVARGEESLLDAPPSESAPKDMSLIQKKENDAVHRLRRANVWGKFKVRDKTGRSDYFVSPPTAAAPSTSSWWSHLGRHTIEGSLGRCEGERAGWWFSRFFKHGTEGVFKKIIKYKTTPFLFSTLFPHTGEV